MNHDSLNDQIAALAPLTDADVATPSLEVAATQLCEDIMSTPMLPTLDCDLATTGTTSQRRRRRGPARVAVIAAVAAVAMTATAAAAIVVEAGTGFFGGGEDSEEGSGELIRLDSPGAGDIVDELAVGIPLPPGGDFAEVKVNLLSPDDEGNGVLMTESGITSTLSYVAACQWTGYWLDAFERGDAAQQAEAQAVLDEIPTWDAIVASDGGGVVEQLRRRADGARAGDPARFMQDYQINCTGELSPTTG